MAQHLVNGQLSRPKQAFTLWRLPLVFLRLEGVSSLSQCERGDVQETKGQASWQLRWLLAARSVSLLSPQRLSLEGALQKGVMRAEVTTLNVSKNSIRFQGPVLVYAGRPT